jgi:hypothetical protein
MSETIKYAFYSKEVRWFLSTKPVDLESWFNEKGLFLENAAARVDFYLAVNPNQNISYKLREGKIEIKLKQAKGQVITFANGHKGRVDKWVKWSLPLKEDTRTPDLLFNTDEILFIELRKKRILIKFGVSPNGKIEVINDKDFSGEGCQVELTYIESKEKNYYSFGFEGYGSESLIDRNFDIVVKKILGGIESPKLEEKNSYSYPVFLALNF